MAPESEYVTVYRSADANAEADANSARDRLADAGVDAIVVGDNTPGVVVGTCEVRVRTADASRAEEILGPEPLEAEEEEITEVDPSHDLDLVAVFSSQTLDAELEAQTINGILEANGIPSFIVGSPQLPVVPCEVKVPHSRLKDAERVLAEAQETGPEAADEAELAGESPEGDSERPV